MSRFSNSLLLRESSDGGSTTLWSTTKTTPPQQFKQTQRVIALNLIRIDDEEMMISRFKVRKVSSHVKCHTPWCGLMSPSFTFVFSRSIRKNSVTFFSLERMYVSPCLLICTFC
jgi:hypothetical protein